MNNELDNQSKLKKIIKKLQGENSELKVKLALAQTNIAQQQASENAAEDSGVRYLNLVLENETSLIFLLDFEKKFAYASKFFLEKVGVKKFDEIKGKYYRDVLSPLIEDANLDRLSGAFHFAKNQSVTIPLDSEYDANGELHMYTAHVTSIVDKKSGKSGIMVLIYDTTEINNALEAAKQANLSKAKFLATMSHELRTPMNAIIGISDIELDRNGYSDETREAFEKINDSGKTLLGIINDILDLSKMESGKLELIPNKYSTAALINDIVRLNIMRIDESPINFIVKVPDDLPASLIGDELRIKQVVNNILSNAIKYTEKGTVTLEVSFKIKLKGISLKFTVTDTGCGMEKEHLRSLIEDEHTSFRREANSSTGGTGLGISITKNLVHLMTGKFDGKSKIGKGSEFTISMFQGKAADDDSILGKDVAASLQNYKFAEKQRAKLVREFMPYGSVLIVDDMNTNLFVASGLMKPYGLKIETALSGREALEKIRGGSEYNIIFMDHMMPELDGMEATRLIRDEKYTLPIVALTANAVLGQDKVFLENGFDAFIAKPIDTNQLNDILNTLIRDKQTPETLEAARLQKENESSAPPAIPVEPARPKPGDPITSLKRLGYLDVNSALDAMSGFPDLYLDTVKLTLRLLPERIEKMDKFIESDLKAFTIEVHGLKSALKNIGAAELGNSASQLEHAALKDDKAFCEENYPGFKVGLLKLEADLNTAFPESTEEKQIADKSALMPAIAEAKIAAENFDRDAALEIIRKHAGFSYGTKTDEALKEIIAALDAFDCEGAQNKITELEGM